MSHNVATLLADAVEDASEIDIARAQRAYDLNKQRLISAGKGEITIDLPEVRAALERATNRIRIYNDTH